jgi:putative endonuclease
MLGWLNKLIKPQKPVTRDLLLGDRGENRAARHLRDKGYKIITRNFTCDLGEVDIIARDGRTLVFVEVKTRESDEQASPDQQVDQQKQHQLTKVAKFYLSRYGFPPPPARFDVVSIVWPTGREPRIEHIQDAFGATM